jgi:hypothetical protein
MEEVTSNARVWIEPQPFATSVCPELPVGTDLYQVMWPELLAYSFYRCWSHSRTLFSFLSHIGINKKLLLLILVIMLLCFANKMRIKCAYGNM